jgi:ATP-dependent helicase/nuclease subunit A
MSTTGAQQQAILATGNVLVAAGAGAGKTSTLVARCVRIITEGGSLENILMVTFTEAAAAEMRARIRKALEESRNETNTLALDPRPSSLDEQLALLDTAAIGTLHSFCFKLVRRHFHELELDPQLNVMDEARTAVLMEETLDELFRQHYTGVRGGGGALEELIQQHAGGREQPVRDLILKIHRYTQTQPNPGAWIAEQLRALADPPPTAWRAYLLEALHEWRARWRGPLRAQPAEHVTAHQIAAQLEALNESSTLENFATVLETVPDARSLKPKFREPEAFFEEASFLRSVTVPRDDVNPLAQDWEWSRGGMETLLQLAQQFALALADAKREQAALDFNDLEQFALRLLWDAKNGTATELGREYQARFHHVFVDECQDINAVQDAIIRAVSRDSQAGNRFLVGDVKQSIYRFRLADPRIFQGYEARWHQGEGGQVIALSDNFRSREVLLDFFNAVFADLMQPEMGRVLFDGDAQLKFGAPEKRRALTKQESPGPRVHLHLRLTEPAKAGSEPEGDSDTAELTGAEHEARIVANRLRELITSGHEIIEYDGPRPVAWGDMAVLLRSPSAKAEIYAREFARQNIPLEVAQSDFFDALEISDLLNVLLLLDNPLQDVPLLAVLRSPLVGLTAGDLAEIRLAARGGYFWTALNRFHETGRNTAEPSAAWRAVDQFLKRFARWRRMGRDSSIGQRLETILAETHYLDWLAAHTTNPQRAAQCLANVRRLLTLARQFDPFQRQGVARFLKFVEAQRAVPGREPMAAGGGAVQLLSIHRSKGLEYPVVIVPDLGKRFNFDDFKADILLHEHLGLCPRIKPPHAGQRYPSLTHWLYTRRERNELLGEEVRLLYVAMTRARDTLLLVGTATRKRAAEMWPMIESSPEELLGASSMLEWLGPWFTRRAPSDWTDQERGGNELFSWRIYSEAETALATGPDEKPVTSQWNFTGHEELLAWKYPFEATTHEAAKTSVSALRRKLAESSEEARPWRPTRPAARATSGELSATEIGTAHHTLLEFATLENLVTETGARAEADLLVTAGVLSEAEARQLNVRGLVQFWNSELGRELLTAGNALRRELPFTARFNAAELRELGLAATSLPDDEFVVVQGVADMAVILRDEIWLLDFKTDDLTPEQVAARAKDYTPQLQAYSAALGKIYGRNVTRRWLHFLATDMTVKV